MQTWILLHLPNLVPTLVSFVAVFLDVTQRDIQNNPQTMLKNYTLQFLLIFNIVLGGEATG